MNKQQYLKLVEAILISNKVVNRYMILDELEKNYDKLIQEGVSDLKIQEELGTIKSFESKYQSESELVDDVVDEAKDNNDQFTKSSFEQHFNKDKINKNIKNNINLNGNTVNKIAILLIIYFSFNIVGDVFDANRSIFHTFYFNNPFGLVLSLLNILGNIIFFGIIIYLIYKYLNKDKK